MHFFRIFYFSYISLFIVKICTGWLAYMSTHAREVKLAVSFLPLQFSVHSRFYRGYADIIVHATSFFAKPCITHDILIVYQWAGRAGGEGFTGRPALSFFHFIGLFVHFLIFLLIYFEYLFNYFYNII